MYSVSESLVTFTRTTLARLLGATVIISLLPLPRDYVLSNAGEVIFAHPRSTTTGPANVLAIAPYLLLIAIASWTRDDALLPPDRWALYSFCAKLC